MPHHTQQTDSPRRPIHPSERLGLHRLPRAAADLVLLGDLTGRYAAGSYSRLGSDGRSVVLREDRQGAAEHGHRITAAIACHVARAGGTVDELTRMLLHPDHEGGRHARHIALRSGQARALDYIRRVWASASAAVASTRVVESRQQAYEVLAALRDRIETTPWRGERGRNALRVLRAHLNFAEIAGGPLHHASERQTAEEAGVSRTTLRVVYETVLKPRGWLRRLRVGHGREGSTWYLGDGSVGHHGSPDSLSRFRTTQYPPDPVLEEWPTPETGAAADIDSTVIGRLMGHDAFAHHGLGSSALMIIGALHARPAQTIGELVGSTSVSRATAYRTLRRLADHGLVHHSGETWSLAPGALEGFGNSLPDVVTDDIAEPAQGWDSVAKQHGTTGVAARRKALHAAERSAYREALERLAEHRSKAVVIVRDGRQILAPAPRPDEIPSAWHAPGGRVLDPVTGRAVPDWRIATDGRLILITPADQRSYDELAAAHAEALSEWESAA
ncbi:helix-turn-helix domain-containing protein [Streptomyces sp. NPDC051207]|uniref:helix-turn-helix domain-containing protein n=1 Tax=Streptomyces sp. NPDC051207 TaxID=3154641 RepID=UPI0034178D22